MKYDIKEIKKYLYKEVEYETLDNALGVAMTEKLNDFISGCAIDDVIGNLITFKEEREELIDILNPELEVQDE